MTTVHDVAAYILRRQSPMTTMKLQKLLYYSQGWALAWDERELFHEDFQAWANGPVCREVFQAHRGQFTLNDWPLGDADALDQNERETVDAVLDSYGHLTGQQLSYKTHSERPWVEARGDTPLGESSRAVVSKAVMQDYFSALVNADCDTEYAL